MDIQDTVDLELNNNLESDGEYASEGEEEGRPGCTDPRTDLTDRAGGSTKPSQATCSDSSYGLNNFLTDIDKEQANDDVEDFLAALAAETQETEGPPLQENVAKLINNNLKRNFDKPLDKFATTGEEKSQGALVITKMKEFDVPSNTPQLKSCRINESIFKALSPAVKRETGDMLYVESAMCKTMVAQGKAMDKLVELRQQLNADGTKILNEVFKCMSDAIEFSAFARSRTNDCRREKVLSNLNTNYGHLRSSTKAENGQLFGDDLETAVKNVETTNRLANKLSAPRGSSRPFLGRGRFRGRGGSWRGRGGYNPRLQHHNQRSNQDQLHYQEQNYAQRLPPPSKKPRLVI